MKWGQKEQGLNTKPLAESYFVVYLLFRLHGCYGPVDFTVVKVRLQMSLSCIYPVIY